VGRRGPKPKPTALKKREGTFRKDRAPANEFAPTPGTPKCPDYLDAIARGEWNRVVPELVAKNVLTIIDGAVLEGFCVAYSSAVKFQKDADKKPIVKTPFGPKVNPSEAVARKWWALARQLGAELGLTPAARTRVSMEKPKPPEDKTEAFLFGPPRLVKPDAVS
jgi:P27 family predicted phage terminase small subunit